MISTTTAVIVIVIMIVIVVAVVIPGEGEQVHEIADGRTVGRDIAIVVVVVHRIRQMIAC